MFVAFSKGRQVRNLEVQNSVFLEQSNLFMYLLMNVYFSDCSVQV